MSSTRRNTSSNTSNTNFEKQQTFHRQANILRKNLLTLDYTLHPAQTSNPEDWPRLLGRFNAAWNQASQWNNQGIDDVLEHFVYLPKKCPANPQDVPFFLSTRLTEVPTAATTTTNDNDEDKSNVENHPQQKKHEKEAGILEEDPTKVLRLYEEHATKLAAEFEENMIRY